MTDRITYAVGDVHGCLAQFRETVAWCASDAADHGVSGLVVFLGDYVDRGPDSRGVIDALMAGPQDPRMEWLALRGNHDDMLARTWFSPEDPVGSDWWEHGGQQTLMSYGWSPLHDAIPAHLGEWIPEAHARFLGSLPLTHEEPGIVFVHAGLRPGVPLTDQTPRDMMWIRGDFSKAGHDFGFDVVHGHTPERGNPAVHPGRVALDSGCFVTGRLACAAFDPGESVPRLRVTGGPAVRPSGPALEGAAARR